MNARELHDKLEYEHKAGLRWLFSSDAQERETVLRALRLLAAAEGGEGTPETSDLAALLTNRTMDEGIILDRMRDMERQRNGLAARVAELEADAERYRWLRVQRHADIAACWYLPVLPQDYPVDTPEQRDIAIDAARGSKP